MACAGMLSFIVPAHDEEASIAATLRAIRAAATSAQAAFEIIVVDDASSDRTAALATAEGAAGRRRSAIGQACTMIVPCIAGLSLPPQHVSQ